MQWSFNQIACIVKIKNLCFTSSFISQIQLSIKYLSYIYELAIHINKRIFLLHNITITYKKANKDTILSRLQTPPKFAECVPNLQKKNVGMNMFLTCKKRQLVETSVNSNRENIFSSPLIWIQSKDIKQMAPYRPKYCYYI